MKALFHCRASLSVGIGHIMRCLTVANFLQDKGWQCDFLVSEETKNISPLAKSIKFKIFHEEEEIIDQYTTVVIDDYASNKKDEEKFRKFSNHITVIDDLADRPHDCDVLIDSTYGYDEKRYESLVPQGCAILAGSCYSMLRPEFKQNRPKAIKKRSAQKGKIDKILIFVGGTDPNNMTSLIIDALLQFNKKFDCAVIMNSQSPYYTDLQKKVDSLKSSSLNISLYENVDNMAEMMLEADFAFGAVGSSTWERCCLGLPSAVIQVADNQKYILAALEEAGVFVNLGSVEDITVEKILSCFQNLVGSTKEIEAMSKNAFDICDGQGVERIFSHFVKNQEKDISLRLAQLDDMQTLFDWQQIESVRKFSRNPEPPEYKAHQKWFSVVLADDTRNIYIIHNGESDIGMVRLDLKEAYKEQPSFEISILIDPAYHGQGIASSALKLIRILEPKSYLWAEIHPDNQASLALFKSLSYKHVSENWHVRHPL